MKKSNLVKLSLVTLVTAVALSVTPNEQIKAAAGEDLRVFNGDSCAGSGGNCLPTIIVKPQN